MLEIKCIKDFREPNHRGGTTWIVRGSILKRSPEVAKKYVDEGNCKYQPGQIEQPAGDTGTETKSTKKRKAKKK